MSSKSSMINYAPYENIEDAVMEAANDGRYTSDSRIVAKMATDFLEPFQNSLATDEKSAFLASKLFANGDQVIDNFDFHRDRVADIMENLHGSNDLRRKGLNRFVWMCLPRNQDRLDADLAVFFVEVAAEAGIPPEEVVTIIRRHMPNFDDHFKVAPFTT
jgi:hypothetical protein